ncbi:HAD-IA family hydrolase [uncultured Gilvimarinus sp.]|uniref:HAD family hydrolase n=1 Tax=uncultured Gilvimarinus sp. TaxID=1689143 RepID=UPI0030EE322A
MSPTSLPIRAIVFDLDGTLLDTAGDFIVVLNKLRHEHNLDPLPDNTIRRTVSNGARALIELGFNCTEGEPGFGELRERLLELYMQHIAVYTQPFNGIVELLHDLKRSGIDWGIATNKPELYTEALLERMALKPAPDIVICPDNVTHRKPDPESLLLAARHFECEPSQIIYLGDHIRDIECGRRAGAVTIGCGYGYIAEDDDPSQWQADYTVNHSLELAPLIAQLIQERHTTG